MRSAKSEVLAARMHGKELYRESEGLNVLRQHTGEVQKRLELFFKGLTAEVTRSDDDHTLNVSLLDGEVGNYELVGKVAKGFQS